MAQWFAICHDHEWISEHIIKIKKDYKWNKGGEHWVPQMDYVTNVQRHGGPDHVYVLHFENLAEEFACLMKTMGINWTWPTFKANAPRGSVTAANLTAETKALVASLYADDFKQFGYDT